MLLKRLRITASDREPEKKGGREGKRGEEADLVDLGSTGDDWSGCSIYRVNNGLTVGLVGFGGLGSKSRSTFITSRDVVPLKELTFL